MVNARRYVTAVVLAVFAVGLGACATPYDYRNIQPTWAVRNSPMPVPYPKAKPVTRIAKANTGTRNAPWARTVSKTTPSIIRVGAGDSVYGLARLYKVAPSQIIALNKLRSPYHLNKGMRLRLKAQTQKTAPRVIKVSQPVRQAAPRTYKVKRGDSLYAIARHQNVSAAGVISANRLKRPYALRVGQVLTLPANTVVQVASSGKRSPDAGSATFIWPAKGRVVSGYGVKANGLRNDGVNISAPKGAAVYASAGGEVIYAGDRLKAFGKLVLIRHRNGFISTYGHNSALLVQRGQLVEQGQQIARVGATGSVAEPQLHFELRRNADAIDPMRYLGRTRMAANSR